MQCTTASRAPFAQVVLPRIPPRDWGVLALVIASWVGIPPLAWVKGFTPDVNKLGVIRTGQNPGGDESSRCLYRKPLLVYFPIRYSQSHRSWSDVAETTRSAPLEREPPERVHDTKKLRNIRRLVGLGAGCMPVNLSKSLAMPHAVMP